MFCPNCRYEFRRGFTKCNECGVDLVDALPPENATPSDSEPHEEMISPTLLWRGYNNSAFNDIRVALDSAAIPYNREELDARVLYTDSYNPLEIWVPAAKLPEAENLHDEIVSRNPSGESGVEPSTANSGLSAELPAEDGEGADDIRNENVARELYPEDATAEVWSGPDATAAEMLKSCLAEIGISCYVERPESGDLAVRVLPEDEKRASSIVRQVVEGVPPE